MIKTVLSEDEKRTLNAVAFELFEIRKLLETLAEKMVKLSDKELLKNFNAIQDDNLRESQIDNYANALEKQVYRAEKEFRP